MTKNPTIVVFDIGNVLIRWDMHFLYESFFPDRAATQAFIDETGLADWNLQQDMGRDWCEAEDDLIGQFPHYEQEIRAFRARWHDTVPGVIAGAVLIKERLEEQGVPLYAITNFAADTFAEAQERFPTLRAFRDIVISGEEKVIKPDPVIYQRLLERNGLEAADCLFIDDSEKNVAGARAVGMHAHHFRSPYWLAEDLKRHGFAI
ncbi:HAD family phosphatase [Cohaesibacter sp. CAU 1516]|uniref:HAD family hydrolase n=1 Tax=Cohaesibacter sp. CAU 1516 TaxID=2576038 RepID=UPI0010FCE18E|nr:HAD family phosphatase [Cohaesibacter sp. CAU 1516]TLP46007.1 HAD family phosphatase [Cohaesibacter sp. CAU 1516]